MTYVDLRERVLDVSGQEIMTADKVTLRINANATVRVTDPRAWSLVCWRRSRRSRTPRSSSATAAASATAS